MESNHERPRPSQIEMGQKQLFPQHENSSPGVRHGDASFSNTAAIVDHKQHIEANWWEFRFKSKQPDRRGYHSSFVNDGM